MVEIIKPSLTENVYAEKECTNVDDVLTSDELLFLENLDKSLDSILENNITYVDPIILNPYSQFGKDHYTVIDSLYSDTSTLLSLEPFSDEYTSLMIEMGHSEDINSLSNGLDIVNEHLSDSNATFYDLRSEIYEAYNVSYFSIQISNIIYSKMSQVESNDNGKAVFYKAEQMISNTSTIQEFEKNELLKGLSVGQNNIDVIHYAQVNGDWKDCASFALSAAGLFTGPFGAVIGISGMALSAGGCEDYLGL